MNSFLVLLAAVLLYELSGTLVDLLYGTKQETSVATIRTKAFVHCYLRPAMFPAVFGSIMISEGRFFNILLGCIWLLAGLIRMIFNKNKYLTRFLITDNKFLTISYVTAFHKTTSQQIEISQITTIEVTNANRLVDHLAAVNVLHKDEWKEFQIVDPKLKAAIQAEIGAGVFNGEPAGAH